MGSAGEKQYYLKWNNFSDNIVTSLDSLRGDEDFVDVTIACEGHSLKAHKVVLSACSQYIKKLLKENPCAHPIIILKDVALAELTALVSFMYNGQIIVSEDQIPQLIKTAEMLEIRGLTEITREAKRAEEMKSEPKDEAHPPAAKRPCPGDQLQVPPVPSTQWMGKRPTREMLAESDEEEDDDDDNDFGDDDSGRDYEAQTREMQVASVLETLNNQHRMQQQLMQHEQRKAAEFNGPNTDEGGGGGQPGRVMALPSSSHRPVDIATRVSQMEDAMMPGDVLVIGETHITPARCVPPRPPKTVPPMSTAMELKAAEEQQQRLSMEMSLRLQVQRKLEAERLRAMERLRHAEAGLMNAGPMDCSNYPGITNGGQEINGHHHHHPREGLNHHQPPQPVVAAPPPPQMAASALSLPLSPDLQLKMLMCRDFKKYTNMLLVAVFGREVLATHCLNGSKGSAKPRLDTDKVTRVIATVMEKFDVPASTVREAIRVKLNNEDKLKKRSKRTANSLM
ncbi:modifier of mdg4-like isoform X1 [Cloeon dipterum]|uniref:modifier of mdg4-like isoform X1 n=1 Tax=Cloeon dipterum TaxID=197152 RepID=UPI00321FF45B